MSVNENKQWRQRIAKENATFRRGSSVSQEFVAKTRGVSGVAPKIGHDEIASEASIQILRSSLLKQQAPSSTLTTSAYVGACLSRNSSETYDLQSAQLTAEILSLDLSDPARSNATTKKSDVVDFAMQFYKVHGRTPMQRKPQS